MLSVLAFGLLAGMQHALDADHMAAVSSLATRRAGIRRILRHGIVWGLGHTTTLLLVAGGAVALRKNIDDGIAALFEGVVGVMLVGLGCHVLRSLWIEGDTLRPRRPMRCELHLHADDHWDDGAPIGRGTVGRRYVERLPWQTFLVGLVHGLAGSAALVLLTAAALNESVWGIAYIVSFGAGSIVGMALFSVALAIPLAYTARSLVRINIVLRMGIGATSVVIGIVMLTELAQRT